MKLELKHIAPYLPYGLKGIYNEGNEENTVIDIIGASFINDKMHYQLKFKGGVLGLFDEDFKPILRPLSDLTKEIEVDGRKFTAAGRMITHGFHNSFWHRDFDYRYLYAADLERLLEWHFDIFELIEEGLAIDINTLNK